MRDEAILYDAAGVAGLLAVMAHETLARFPDGVLPVFIGVKTRGAFLADRLAREVEMRGHPRPVVATIQVRLYDDRLVQVAPSPIVGEVSSPVPLRGRPVLLVDDVLFSGRTVLSAAETLLRGQGVRSVRVAVLVDRGHAIAPIRPETVGARVATKPSDQVKVMLAECDGRDEIRLLSGR